jgi:tRNA 2-thiouridine synthesizing protein A
MVVKKLDVRGTKCPIPIVQAKKMIDTMAAGEIVEVMATDPGSVPDFQGWAKTAKYALLKEQRQEKDEKGQEVYIHVLERKA